MNVDLTDNERAVIKNVLLKTPMLPMEWEGVAKPIVIKMGAQPAPEPVQELVHPVEQ